LFINSIGLAGAGGGVGFDFSEEAEEGAVIQVFPVDGAVEVLGDGVDVWLAGGLVDGADEGFFFGAVGIVPIDLGADVFRADEEAANFAFVAPQ